MLFMETFGSITLAHSHCYMKKSSEYPGIESENTKHRIFDGPEVLKQENET